MNELTWIRHDVVLAVHDEQLAEHGGLSGIRDSGLLESAISRPMNIAAYGEPEVWDLAAAYGYGIARNHPFIDGNKRTAFVAMELFLQLNGHELTATDEECVMIMLQVAEGSIEEAELAKWLNQKIESL